MWSDDNEDEGYAYDEDAGGRRGGGGGGDCVGGGVGGRLPSRLERTGRVSRRGFVGSVGDAGLGGVVGGVALIASGLGRAGRWLLARVTSVGIEEESLLTAKKDQ